MTAADRAGEAVTPGQLAYEGFVAFQPGDDVRFETWQEKDETGDRHVMGRADWEAAGQAVVAWQQAAIAAQQPQAAPESVPWRQGRTQPRNIYARTGGGDWKADLMIGQLDTAAAAAEAVRAHNAALGEQPAPELADAMGETRELREGIAALIDGLKTTAAATHPSKKSEIEFALIRKLTAILEAS